MSAIAREKLGKCRAGGHESVRISVIMRVSNSGSLFQPFLYAFRREDASCLQWRGVRNSEVSVGRESIVHLKM